MLIDVEGPIPVGITTPWAIRVERVSCTIMYSKLSVLNGGCNGINSLQLCCCELPAEIDWNCESKKPFLPSVAFICAFSYSHMKRS